MMPSSRSPLITGNAEKILHARPAAERGKGRRRVIGQPLAQRARVAALHRLAHLLDVRERHAHFVAAADHSAAVIEHAQAGERGLLGFEKQTRKLRADPQHGTLGRHLGWDRIRPARPR